VSVSWAFAGAVFTVQDNWKQKATDLENQVKSADVAFQDLETEFEQYKNDTNEKLTNETNRADLAENQSRILEQRLQVKTTELETTKTSLDTERALAAIAGDEARERRKEAEEQRRVNQQLQKDLGDLISRNRSLNDELFGLNTEQQLLVEKHDQTLSELAFLKKVVRVNGLDTDPKKYIAKETPPPPVVGKVITTKYNSRNGQELVQISIGSDDGLLKGHQVYVYRLAQASGRQAKFLGELRIDLVTPDEAVGTVISRAKNGVIEKGDNVSTKL